jgi:hypothetical protein
VREVFYGRPLLEFIGRKTFAAFARRDEIAAAVRAQWADEARIRLAKEAGVAADEIPADRLTEAEIAPRTWPGQEHYASPFYDTLKQIHIDWLLTPRDDLGGACPREIAFEQHDHLMRDLEDRCHHWSLLGECPPGLAESSHAFRYGGFGTHELVMYYELVRALLWSCWGRLAELAESPKISERPESLTVGDFLTTEVQRLEAVRDAWLDAPDPEYHGRTPRSIILRERARLPEGMSGREAMIDPDCPCCQMMADMPGLMFWHLDGSGMDNEFAFDCTAARARSGRKSSASGKSVAGNSTPSGPSASVWASPTQCPAKTARMPSGRARSAWATRPTCRWGFASLASAAVWPS